MNQQKKNILANGGSIGSGEVLRTLLGGLAPDLPASIFVTTRISAHSAGILAENLNSKSALPVIGALDGQPVESGHVYVAPPDRHLLVIGDTIRLGDGPRENMVRPAIDPMFRSVALSYGPRAVGLVLSGMLDDGAAGLHAIKSCGGTAVVQHPLAAKADEMPLAALEATQVDHVVHRDDLARTLTEIAGRVATGDHHPSHGLRLEVEIAAGRRLGSSELSKISGPSPISCPHCQGVRRGDPHGHAGDGGTRHAA
ncbi:chemotaxis protein CheB [Paracoccus benzoatiresistens]|uniref:protein-glutamate methylesterase n=1 Tax=Paracoccus benzoatiresistens TaxID=2997341 RepID=A0ABT4J3S6_9RHOB|nr:chemotaxis protein CheB [Paracoccus sp. EF6]MCZ0961031.1 chemotaxis protein CheB [Paracoccus sp. EF6]